MGLGQVADWCVLSNDYSHRQLSLVVYRNEKRLLDMTFSNWPDTPIVSLGEARSLAFQMLAPYAPGSASGSPSPAPNSSKSDKLDQFKITQSKKAEATACELVSKSDVESVAGPIDRTPTPNRAGTAETLCSFHFSDGRTITVRKYNTSEPITIEQTRKNSQTKTLYDCNEVAGIGDWCTWDAPGHPLAELKVFENGIVTFGVLIAGLSDHSVARVQATKLASLVSKALGLHDSPQRGDSTIASVQPGVQPLPKPALSKAGACLSKEEQLKHDLTSGAEAGNAQAQFALGTLYEYAHNGSIQPDYAGAAYWYQQASGKGMAQAMRALARLYGDGRGVPKDEWISMELFKKAAALGDVPSMAELGAAYLRQGTLVGRTRAKPWLQKAVDAGHVSASVDLGVLYYLNARDAGVGMNVFRQRDYDSAMRAYRTAANAGNCVAYMNIGGLYFNGDRVPQDKRQAESWFAKAESCSRASNSAILDKASTFRQKAANGRLPAMEAATSSASKMSTGDVLLGLAIVSGLAVVAYSMAHDSSAQGRKAGNADPCPGCSLIEQQNQELERSQKDRDFREEMRKHAEQLERERQLIEDRDKNNRLLRCGWNPKPGCS
jgi:TPR repeat protein